MDKKQKRLIASAARALIFMLQSDGERDCDDWHFAQYVEGCVHEEDADSLEFDTLERMGLL